MIPLAPIGHNGGPPLEEPDPGASGRLHLWRDPETGYLRRAVTPSGSDPELVRVELPAGARVDYPASTYLSWKHVIWVLEGELLFHEGAARHRLAAGDCLVLGAPADCGFENASEQPCGYLVVLSRR